MGVERQPDMYEFLVSETDCSIQSRPQHSMFVSLARKDCGIHSRRIMFQPLLDWLYINRNSESRVVDCVLQDKHGEQTPTTYAVAGLDVGCFVQHVVRPLSCKL